jgi:hypothetical protein
MCVSLLYHCLLYYFILYYFRFDNPDREETRRRPYTSTKCSYNVRMYLPVTSDLEVFSSFSVF